MQYKSNTSGVSTRSRRLTDAEATTLDIKMVERRAYRDRRAGIVARVMCAINSVRHQITGAIDAAATLVRVPPDDAQRLTATAAEIVRDNHDGGPRC